MVFVEKVIPLGYAQDENIIVLQRQSCDLNEIRKKLNEDVKFTRDEDKLELNVVYAMRKNHHKLWSRATVKFFDKRSNCAVLQKLDEKGTINFDPKEMHVKKVQNEELKKQDAGLFKMFVYGVMPYKQSRELDLIFNQMLRGQKVTAVFELLETKLNQIHECYAGDLICSGLPGKLVSFREILINEKLTYPARVDGALNQRILQKRACILAEGNGITSILTYHETFGHQSSHHDVQSINVIGSRFYIQTIIAEGSVSFSLSYCFYHDIGRRIEFSLKTV